MNDFCLVVVLTILITSSFVAGIFSGAIIAENFFEKKCLVENQFTINGNVFQCKLIKE